MLHRLDMRLGIVYCTARYGESIYPLKGTASVPDCQILSTCFVIGGKASWCPAYRKVWLGTVAITEGIVENRFGCKQSHHRKRPVILM